MLDIGCGVGSIWPAMTKYVSHIKAIDSIGLIIAGVVGLNLLGSSD